MQTKANAKFKGVDVSHHNGNIDWNKVKADGVQFAFVKASEGTTFIDDKYIANVDGARAAGLLAGAYHFARPENGNPIGEAKNFISVLETTAYDLMPVLDLESPDGGKISTAALVQWVKTFVDYVHQATGFRVIMYTGNWYLNTYDQLNNAFSDMPLWIANYGNIDCPPDGGGWSRWTAWQYSDKGRVNGIGSGVDLNVAESLEALMANPPVKVVDAPLPVQFSVFQYAVKLCDCTTQDEAAAEAAKWDHACVKRISDGTIVFHNWKDDNQVVSFFSAPDFVKPTLVKLVAQNLIEDVSGDYTFYRILALLDRTGAFGK